MTDGRFSSAPSPAGDDRFGYFGMPQASPPSQFGGGAPSQLGAAAPVAFGAPYATSPPPAPAASPRRGSRLRPAVVVVLAMLVLGGGFVGYRMWKHNQPLTMPATLSGLPQATDQRIISTTQQLGTQLQQANPNLRTQTAAYAQPGDLSHVLITAAGRGHSDIDKDFAEAGGAIGALQPVGSSTCAASTDKTMTICERTSGDLTVIVLSVGTAGPQPPQTVAATVDEIWNQL